MCIRDRANTVKYLAENPEIAGEIEAKIREVKLGNITKVSDLDDDIPEYVEGMENE